MARILLAEDDSAIRSFVTRALEQRGHEVVAAADGLQALDILRRQRFDLLISDIVMPGLDGVALALRLAEEQPDLPILLMSGHGAERRRAQEAADLDPDILPKPFTLQQVCDAVDAALKKRH